MHASIHTYIPIEYTYISVFLFEWLAFPSKAPRPQLLKALHPLVSCCSQRVHCCSLAVSGNRALSMPSACCIHWLRYSRLQVLPWLYQIRQAFGPNAYRYHLFLEVYSGHIFLLYEDPAADEIYPGRTGELKSPRRPFGAPQPEFSGSLNTKEQRQIWHRFVSSIWDSFWLHAGSSVYHLGIVMFAPLVQVSMFAPFALVLDLLSTDCWTPNMFFLFLKTRHLLSSVSFLYKSIYPLSLYM